MTLWYVEEILPAEISQNHAGSKAHNDIRAILGDMGLRSKRVGLSLELWQRSGVLASIDRRRKVYSQWKDALCGAAKGDVVVVQYPFVHAHELLGFPRIVAKSQRKDVKIILLIHDLESFRLLKKEHLGKDEVRLAQTEQLLISASSSIIVHNDVMRGQLVADFGVDPGKVVSLGIFDYLVEGDATARDIHKDAPIVVAGNLNEEKAGYLYQLPADVSFNLYGPNCQAKNPLPENVHYWGSFPPDELPGVLSGSFGLVWDGSSAETCVGVFGEYLRVNNPHKTSFYLSMGLPVAIWKEAALAPFIVERGAGIAVASLHDLHDAISSVDEAGYRAMREAALSLSEQLRSGHFTCSAIDRACEIAQAK